MNNTPCRECGEPVGDSIGDAYGLCQEYWEGCCEREFWNRWNQLAEIKAKDTP